MKLVSNINTKEGINPSRGDSAFQRIIRNSAMLSSTAILVIPEFFRALSEKYPGSSYWQYNGLSACPPLAEIFLFDKYIAKTDKNFGMTQVVLANLRMFPFNCVQGALSVVEWAKGIPLNALESDSSPSIAFGSEWLTFKQLPIGLLNVSHTSF